ncbi:MAG: type IV pilus biogenesis/stability protein PilW [Moraxellaceae bacterium]|nr:type IV pilus biogenesis/stability protein PilW [Moraxellaceae bacterium]
MNINLVTTRSTKLFVSMLVVSCFGLSACETTKTVSSINYQGSPTGIGNKKQTKSEKENIAKIRTALAGQYIRQRQLDAAQRQLNMALDANRNYAPAYDMLGVLLQQEGSQLNLVKAEKNFKKAIRLDKNFVQAHNNYGVYLSYMKRYQEAVQQFEIAGASLGYEGRTGALENLGRTYLKLNNKSQAIKSFQRALENNSNSLIARIELVDLFIAKDDYQQARQLFEELQALLGKRPLKPRLLLQGAKLSQASQDINSRQEYIQQLLSEYPLSKEAKLVKKWLSNPSATWK